MRPFTHYLSIKDKETVNISADSLKNKFPDLNGVQYNNIIMDLNASLTRTILLRQFFSADRNTTFPLENLNETFLNDLLMRFQELSNITETILKENKILKETKVANQSLSQLQNNATRVVTSTWPFIQGLVVGQLSILILLIFFIKFFIFADVKEKDNNPLVSNIAIRSKRHGLGEFRQSINSTSTSTNPLIFFSTILKRGGEEVKTINNKTGNFQENEIPDRSIQIRDILNKTSYDVNLHRSESLDWFNVLIAQIIEQFREEAISKNNILTSLNNFFTNKLIPFPDYLDTIKVTELDIGNNFPIFSNCRIENEKQQLEAKIDIDLKDRLALGIETKLLLNFPKKSFAALPISLTVAIVKFHGSLTVSLTRADELIHPSEGESTNQLKTEAESRDGNGYFLVFSFSPEYILEFKTTSLIGARSKLENTPKIASLIEYQIKKWFFERCVEPRFQFIKLPSIWPRSTEAREEKNDTSSK